jgi:predicted nucleic acid-binding protein
MSDAEIRRERESIEFFAEFVVPDVDLQVVERDPDDDKFLEVALAGDADYIVSGDTHLTDLESFRELPILTPREFLDVLDEYHE